MCWVATARRSWFLDATRIAELALDSQISPLTANRYLHEANDR